VSAPTLTPAVRWQAGKQVVKAPQGGNGGTIVQLRLQACSNNGARQCMFLNSVGGSARAGACSPLAIALPPG
jgi:hypothetical protein